MNNETKTKIYIIESEEVIKTVDDVVKNDMFKSQYLDNLNSLIGVTYGNVKEINVRNDLVAILFLGNFKALGGNRNVPETCLISNYNNDNYVVTSLVFVQKKVVAKEKLSFIDKIKHIIKSKKQ